MIMLKKLSFIALSFSILFVLSCVSKSKYVDLETSSNATQAQLEEDKKGLQAQIDKLQSENKGLLESIEGLKLELKQERMAIKKKEKKISEMDKTRQEIETSLKKQILQKDIKIEEFEGKLKVTFVDKILFDSGSVTIKQTGQEVLLRLADSFRGNKAQNLVIEGHTDNVQIGSVLQERFPTNWELSTARATAVVRFFQEKGDIEPERLTASGFSFYRPVDSNETEEGRKQNRRIEIILVPKR
jgi:chemotaxis protein MotB